jgi:hypothetical protein
MASDTEQRIAVLAYLVDRFPRDKVPQQTIRAYCEDLAEVPLDLLWAAAKKIGRHGSYFPTIAAILDAVEELHEAERQVPSAEDAWDWVCRWLSSSGEGRDSEGYELAEHAVSRIGGWKQLGLGDVTDRHWVCKRFREAYGQVLEEDRKLQRMSPEERKLIEGEDTPSYFERTGRMERLGGGKMLKGLLTEAKERTENAGGEG